MPSWVFFLVSEIPPFHLLVNKYLLSTYSIPGTVLGTRNVAGTKVAQIPEPCKGQGCVYVLGGGAGGRRYKENKGVNFKAG